MINRNTVLVKDFTLMQMIRYGINIKSIVADYKNELELCSYCNDGGKAMECPKEASKTITYIWPIDFVVVLLQGRA